MSEPRDLSWSEEKAGDSVVIRLEPPRKVIMVVGLIAAGILAASASLLTIAWELVHLGSDNDYGGRPDDTEQLGSWIIIVVIGSAAMVVHSVVSYFEVCRITVSKTAICVPWSVQRLTQSVRIPLDSISKLTIEPVDGTWFRPFGQAWSLIACLKRGERAVIPLKLMTLEDAKFAKKRLSTILRRQRG